MKIKLLLLAGVLLWLSACRTPKDMIYVSGIDRITPEQLEGTTQAQDIKIGTDDMLTISVSSMDPTVVAPFNPPAFGYYPQNELDATATVQNLHTYLVDGQGNINFPVVGEVHLSGLNVQEAGRALQEKLKEMAPDVMVNVQLVNFRVGIFGEVMRPNVYTIRKNRISILELLTMAGDLTVYGVRTNVLLIRETDGKKEFARLNLTDENLFASPYYYLKQNDLIYVQPNKARQRGGAGQNYLFSIVQTVTTGVSVISTIVFAIITTNKR